MTQAKRRLPVLQNRPDEGPERPRWQWVLIGAAATVIAWLPLLMLAMVFLAALQSLIAVVALGVASFLGGLMVGRFGGQAGRRHAVYGGLLAANVFSVPTMILGVAGGARMPASWLWAPLTVALIALVAAGASYLGGALGVRLRPPK